MPYTYSKRFKDFLTEISDLHTPNLRKIVESYKNSPTPQLVINEIVEYTKNYKELEQYDIKIQDFVLAICEYRKFKIDENLSIHEKITSKNYDIWQEGVIEIGNNRVNLSIFNLPVSHCWDGYLLESFGNLIEEDLIVRIFEQIQPPNS